MDDKPSVHCAGCGQPVTESQPTPCPNCGSFARTITAQAKGTASVWGSVRVEQEPQVADAHGAVVNPGPIKIEAELPQGSLVVGDPQRLAADIMEDMRIAMRYPRIDDMRFHLEVNGVKLSDDDSFDEVTLAFMQWFYGRHYDGPRRDPQE